MNDYLVTVRHIHSDFCRDFLVTATHSQFAKLAVQKFLRRRELASIYSAVATRPVAEGEILQPTLQRITA